MKHGISCINGSYKDGILVGEGRVQLAENESGCIPTQYPHAQGQITLEGSFTNGYLEGPVRGVDEKGLLVFVGMYFKGLPTGHCWQAREGQGWVYGKVDEKTGRFSGQNISFIYPDFVTCLTGTFEEGKMVEAKPSCISCAMYGDFTEEGSDESDSKHKASPILNLQVSEKQ